METISVNTDEKFIKHELSTILVYLKALQSSKDKLTDSEKAYLEGIEKKVSNLVKKLEKPIPRLVGV